MMAEVFKEPEGATPLHVEDRAGLLHKHVTTRAQLDELEQANIEQGLMWLSRTRQKEVLTDEFAIRLHKRLFGEVWAWAGTLRRHETNIGIDPLQIGVKLNELMGDARYWVEHKVMRPSEAAATLHHRMVSIHPFPNGNGRHSRIMADVMLMRSYGAPPIDWEGGHALQKMGERREAYLKALRAADGHDYGPLLSFIGPRPDLSQK